MIIEMEQGSLEWHEHRNTYRNASEAAIIMGCAPKYWNMTKRKLWEQKQGLIGSNVSDTNPAIVHGNNMEAAARDCFNRNFKANVTPVVGIRDEYSASLDGYGPDSEGQMIKVEIKCPWKGVDSEVWKMAASGQVAPYYQAQMLHQDYVVASEQSFFMVYISDDQFLILPHMSLQEDTDALLAAWDDWASCEPEPDWYERDDETMLSLVSRHKELILQKSIIDKDLKKTESQLKKEAGEKNTIAFGCKIQTIERIGNVDYKSVPDLSGIDLELYRKPPTQYQKISYQKESS